MKHVANYIEFLYEGKKQYRYLLKVEKDFNTFNLLNDLKPLGAEVLDNQPDGKSKDHVVITIVMDDSKRTQVEETIRNTAEIIKNL
jgi:hypothetical protein